MDDLENTFAMDNMSSTLLPVSDHKAGKQSITTLLDITRANHVAIMLSRIKMSLPEIRKALLDVDDAKLSIDDLKAISKQLPTSEEITRLRGCDDIGKLAKADQYFHQIMTIPRLSERLECMIFRRRLELEIEEIRPELNILRSASREVRSSIRFKGVLQAVLAIGNALNSSSFRGGARGFKLDALLKMRETKTVKGSDCPTLLHYLARLLLRTDSMMINFIEEMPHLEAAARVSVQTIAASILALTNGLNQVNEEVKNVELLRLINDHFVQVMRPFVGENTQSIDAMKKMGAALDIDLRSLLAYYGEAPDSPETPKPEDLFALILSFSSSLQKAALEVHDAETKIMASSPSIVVNQQELEELTIKGSKEQTDYFPASQGRTGGLHSVGRGEVDQAIRSMRDGKRRARPHRPVNKIFFDGGRP